MTVTGKDFVDALIYELRQEYSGFVDIPKLLEFINDTSVSFISQIIITPNADLTELQTIRVVTNGKTSDDQYPILKNVADQYIYLPGMRYRDIYTLTDINGNEKEYPSMLKLVGISVLDDMDEDPVNVTIVNQSIYNITKKRMYRSPSKKDKRCYGFSVFEDVYSVYFIDPSYNYYIIDYFKYPDEVKYTNDILSFSTNLATRIRAHCLLKFLERIKDERFRNFVSQPSQ